MTDLSLVCGLPIKLDEDTNNIFYSETVSFEKQVEVMLSEITPVLLNKFLRYPEKVYRQYSNVYFLQDKEDLVSNKISYDVIQIPYGLLGIEFVKTHVYYTEEYEDKYACIVEVIKGDLTVLIQRNAPEDDFMPATFVDEISIIHIQEGEKFAVPTGVFYTFVNSGTKNVVFSIVAPKNMVPVDYSVLQKEKGLAFYIISKNARLEVVANPKYKLNCCANHVIFSELQDDEKQRFIPSVLDDKEEPLYNILRKRIKEIEEIVH